MFKIRMIIGYLKWVKRSMEQTVIKRDGSIEPVNFDKITVRVRNLSAGLDSLVDVTEVAKKVCNGVYPGVTTEELDTLASETAASMSTRHHDYSRLAARISVSNMHKKTLGVFSKTMEKLASYVNPHTNSPAPLVSSEFMEIVSTHRALLDSGMMYNNDFEYDYFGLKTLERSYLMKVDGVIVERPQDMLMRVSIGIHGNDIDNVFETYDLLSRMVITHASPTLFNAGTPRPQMSSCFLLTMKDDSIEGIYDTLKQCAMISKAAGGIGLAAHDIRSKGSYISGTNGTSNGIVPMLRVFNDTARYVDQGGGKRKGAFAVYIEPWHADIFDFLDLKKNHGKEENRARDLFYGLWIPDLFMKRVEDGGKWTLFCPNDAPLLSRTHGPEFEAIYTSLENYGYGKEIDARSLWFAILESQIETGTPYMLYKDACNLKSNQSNLGTIRCSNLCTEVVQYTSPEEVAVCNLASVALNKFVVLDEDTPRYDFEGLAEAVGVMTFNLNKVIDNNYYPVEEALLSNMRHRPIGIGVQGLADAFILMRYPFESDDARILNRHIFETIYFAAVRASNELSKISGPYESYQGSPISKGHFQFDMWGVVPEIWDWKALRDDVLEYGVRNSLLVAPMPTASTSQIMGNNECFEPYTSNIYTRRVLAGEFIIVNHHLVRDLQRVGMWNESMKDRIVANGGSVQSIAEIPKDLRELYKTAWEISQKRILDLAADRGAYIDQSQSMNVFMSDANISKLSSMHFYGWKLGLKTGMYYLRTKAAAVATQVTIEPVAACPMGGAQTGGSDCLACGA